MNPKLLKQKILETFLNGEWERVKLGDVLKIKSGQNLTSKNMGSDGNIPVYGGNGITGYHDEANIDKPTIVIGRVGFYCGSIHITEQNAWVTDNAFITSYDENVIFTKWFYYLLIHLDLRQYSNSTAQPVISGRTIFPISIPLPPLTVQRQIVSQIETLFSEIDRIEQSRQNLLQAVKMARQKTLKVFLTGDWEMVKLGDVCDYGKCKTVKNANIPDDAWILDLEDIEKDTGKLLQRTLKTEKNTTSVRHSFKKGDVLYSKLRTYLNKVLIADVDGFCTTEIIPIDFKGKIIPEFARFVLMSPMFLEYTEQCGYGVKMPRLGTNDAKKADFPLPPLTVQRQIVSKIEAIFGEINQIENAVIPK